MSANVYPAEVERVKNAVMSKIPQCKSLHKNREDCSRIVINHNSITVLSTGTDNDDLLLIKQLIESATFVGL